MILNPNLYKNSLDNLKGQIMRAMKEPESARIDELTLLSLTAHVPYAALLMYVLRPDVCGDMDYIKKILESNVKYYNYEIIEWNR